jgi:hypothetical protein
MLAIIAAFVLATTISPSVPPAKYAHTYPPKFHDNSVAMCVDVAKKGGATPEEMKLAPVLCDCTFWVIENNFPWKTFKAMTPEQRGQVFDAAINGCVIRLSEPEKKQSPKSPVPTPIKRTA